MFDTLLNNLQLGARSYLSQNVESSERSIVYPSRHLYDTTNPITSYTNDNVYFDAYAQEIWVYVAITSIAEACGQVPLKIFDVRNRSNPVDVTYDPRFAAFLHPNSRMSKFRLWEATHSFLRLLGCCYWEMQPNIRNVERIYVLRPDYVEIVPDAKRGVKEYLYHSHGKNSTEKPTSFSPDEIVEFKTFNPYTQNTGISPLSPAKLSIAADLLSQKYNISFFENQASPQGVYTTDQVLSDSKLERLRAQLITMRQRVQSYFTPVILHGGLKYSATSLGPKDVEFASGRQLNRQDILSSQRVPGSIAGISQQNFAEAKNEAALFRMYRILPLLRALQSDIDSFILYSIGPNLECQFDVEGIPEYKEDLAGEEERLRTRFDRGILSVDQYLQAIRKPAIGGVMGSRRFVLASLYMVDEAGVHVPLNENTDKSGRTGEGKSKQYKNVETGELVSLEGIV